MHAESASGSRRRSKSRARSRKRGSEQAGELFVRVMAAVVALACLLAALLLAAQHPLAPWAAGAGVLALLLLGRYFWMMAPGWSLGLMPWLAFAPFSGWLLVEEFDIALLALLAGGYFAISGPHRQTPPPELAPARRQLRWRRGVLLLMALALASALAAVLRGLSHGSFGALDFFDAYREPEAALRALKPLLALLLMLPLWLRVARRRPDQLTPSLLAGASLGLLGCALPALAERWLFGELGSLAAEPRVSGLFWEQHIGGGVPDAALALLLPLLLLQGLRLKSRVALLPLALLLGLGLAAALWRFSLGLSLALGLTLPLTLLAWWLQRRRHVASARRPAPAALALSLLLLVGLVPVLGIGASAALARMAHQGPDFSARLQHARQVLAAVETGEHWLFGVGAGRFVPVFSAAARVEDRIGDYRLHPGKPMAIWLRNPEQVADAEGLLRLSQHLSEAPNGLQLHLQARHDAPQRLRVEVCTRHVIHARDCRHTELLLPASPGSWREHSLSLPDGSTRWPALSLQLLTPGGEIELSQLSLKSADGREQLRNGDFGEDLTFWFPSHDRHHLPWHAKSLPLHLLFEQGLLGLALTSLLTLGALARLSFGEAREHPLAPALLGGLLGLTVIGLFDSLIDAPRIAFLALTLLVLALGLRAPPPDTSS